MQVFRSGLRPLLTRTVTLTLLGACLASMPPLASAEPLPHRPGEILDTRSGNSLSPDTLYEQLQRHKLVLIGEQHDNAEHHAVESLLIEELVTPGTAAVLEMLGPGLPLDTLGVTTSKDELATALKEGTPGWDWNSYGRIYHQILQQGGKLVSGNLGREQIQALYKGEETTLPQRELDSRAALGDDVRSRMAADIRAQHCNEIPADRLDRMVEIQLARDARMAAALESHRGMKPAVLLAGGYHVRRDLGVPRHLQNDDEAVLMLVSVDDQGNPVGGDELLSPEVADYVWFTSASEQTDYCAEKGTASGAEASKAPE